jgi:hypothetical protein
MFEVEELQGRRAPSFSCPGNCPNRHKTFPLVARVHVAANRPIAVRAAVRAAVAVLLQRHGCPRLGARLGVPVVPRRPRAGLLQVPRGPKVLDPLLAKGRGGEGAVNFMNRDTHTHDEIAKKNPDGTRR